MPFKPDKSVTDQHTHFVNQVRFSPDGTKFASASSDKNVVLFNSDSAEVIKKIEGAHSKGILDLAWLDDENFMTCSSDNSIKLWNQNGEVHKTL